MDFLETKNGSANGKAQTIEKLITSFEDYLRKFKEKLKLNSLFNKFELIFKNDISILTKLSNIRYKLIKSGNKIENVLFRQNPLFFELVFKYFYNVVRLLFARQILSKFKFK